jgi:SCY1-like protein 1
LKIAKHLPPVEYDSKIAPIVVQYFNANDRSLRMTLLQVCAMRARARARVCVCVIASHCTQNLESFAPNLNATLVDSKIFPAVATGFGDSSAPLREATVKAMLLVCVRVYTAVMMRMCVK